MKYHLSIVFAGFFLIIFSAYVANAGMACALKTEKQALDVRAMQSQLMVAALSCGERNDYNRFVNEHRDDLIRNSEFLKSYFKRNYPNNAEVQMNKFITTLANESSKKSLDKNQMKFCEEASEIFNQVRVAKVTKVSDFAAKQEFSGLHQITECN